MLPSAERKRCLTKRRTAVWPECDYERLAAYLLYCPSGEVTPARVCVCEDERMFSLLRPKLDDNFCYYICKNIITVVFSLQMQASCLPILLNLTCFKQNNI